MSELVHDDGSDKENGANKCAGYCPVLGSHAKVPVIAENAAANSKKNGNSDTNDELAYFDNRSSNQAKYPMFNNRFPDQP